MARRMIVRAATADLSKAQIVAACLTHAAVTFAILWVALALQAL